METLYMLALIWAGHSDPTNNMVYFFYRDESACVAEETRRNASYSADTRAKWVCMNFLCTDGAEVSVMQEPNKKRGVPHTASCKAKDFGGWATETEQRLCGKLRAAGQECTLAN